MVLDDGAMPLSPMGRAVLAAVVEKVDNIKSRRQPRRVSSRKAWHGSGIQACEYAPHGAANEAGNRQAAMQVFITSHNGTIAFAKFNTSLRECFTTLPPALSTSR